MIRARRSSNFSRAHAFLNQIDSLTPRSSSIYDLIKGSFFTNKISSPTRRLPVVANTNKNLRELVKTGAFRS